MPAILYVCPEDATQFLLAELNPVIKVGFPCSTAGVFVCYRHDFHSGYFLRAILHECSAPMETVDKEESAGPGPRHSQGRRRGPIKSLLGVLPNSCLSEVAADLIPGMRGNPSHGHAGDDIAYREGLPFRDFLEGEVARLVLVVPARTVAH